MLKGVAFIEGDGRDGKVHLVLPDEHFRVRLPVAGEIVDIHLDVGQYVRFRVEYVRWLLEAGTGGKNEGERFDVHVYIKREDAQSA
jgi:hypothetical protein